MVASPEPTGWFYRRGIRWAPSDERRRGPTRPVAFSCPIQRRMRSRDMTENTTSPHRRSGYGAQSAQPFAVGMKSYDNDWYLRFNLSYDAAAALLSDWGVTFVIAQSRALPMPDSAVKSEVRPELKERFASYDDRKFRDALARRCILYIATCAMF